MDRPDLAEPRFSQADALQILPEFKPSTLQNWATRGTSEGAAQSPGRQAKRMYTGRGLVDLRFRWQLSEMMIPPGVASQFSDKVVTAAQQIWDAELETPDEAGCPYIVTLGGSLDVYRRGYIWREDAETFALRVQRAPLLRLFTRKPHLVVEVDLTAIDVLNAIHRHLHNRAIVPGSIGKTVKDYDARLARLRALPESIE